MDAIYNVLLDFKANGGGDTPESVNQALSEAVAKMSWSKSDEVFKVLFLVGDSPPHMDYQDDVKYADTCKQAAKGRIVINTIQCGTRNSTVAPWQEIARLAEGKYFAILQSGGMARIETPHDGELAKLSREVDGTVLPYGSRDDFDRYAEKRVAASKIEREAPSEALAERAVYKAKASGVATLSGGKDLVQDYKDKKVDLSELKQEEMPKELRDTPVEQIKQRLEELAGKREVIRQRIRELEKLRSAYIKEKAAKPDAAKDSFDEAVMKAIAEQAAKVGITFEKSDKK